MLKVWRYLCLLFVADIVVDVGSGKGFPHIVCLAIMPIEGDLLEMYKPTLPNP